MLYKQYKYKFYLNMNHSVEIEGQRGLVHSHTWEIAMAIAMGDTEIVRFSEIEKYISMMLQKYQDKYLNDIPPFNVINPTLEDTCNYLFELFSKELREKGWLLLGMEMSETPSRVYQVTGIHPEDDFTFS